jgi:hypothetical protein
MGCSFSINFTQPAEMLVAAAEKALTEAGGKFDGTETNGAFSLFTPLGNVRGSYMISEGTIRVVVHEKPMLVGCNRIENIMRKYLAG